MELYNIHKPVNFIYKHFLSKRIWTLVRFFFQRRSMLDSQRRMREEWGRSNLETVFGVTALPSYTWIRAQMDQIPSEQFSGIFNSTLKIADGAGLLDECRILDVMRHRGIH
jgi:hypothetical protein